MRRTALIILLLTAVVCWFGLAVIGCGHTVETVRTVTVTGPSVTVTDETTVTETVVEEFPVTVTETETETVYVPENLPETR